MNDRKPQLTPYLFKAFINGLGENSPSKSALACTTSGDKGDLARNLLDNKQDALVIISGNLKKAEDHPNFEKANNAFGQAVYGQPELFVTALLNYNNPQQTTCISNPTYRKTLDLSKDPITLTVHCSHFCEQSTVSQYQNQTNQFDFVEFHFELDRDRFVFTGGTLSHNLLDKLNRVFYQRIGDKIGGAQSGGESGGIYDILNTESGKRRRALVKREHNPIKNIAEYFVSSFARSIKESSPNIPASDSKSPNTNSDEKHVAVSHTNPSNTGPVFAEIQFIPEEDLPRDTPAAPITNAAHDQKNPPKNPYIASYFVAKNAKDLWQYVYERYLSKEFEKERKEHGHMYITMPTARPKRLGSGEPKVIFDTVMKRVFEANQTLKQ